MGRPTKLDDLTAKRIVDAVAAGVSRVGAAKSAGVGKSTLMEWLQRGRDGEQPYADFADQIRKADGQIEHRVVSALLNQIEEGHVGAMCFWLERRRPEEWGKRDSVVHEHTEGGRERDGSDLEVARSVVAALESRKTGT